MKSLKEQVEGLEISQPPDFDPEDDPFAKRDDASDSDDAPSETGIAGREHYEEVEKSKLRKPEQPVLGKQYSGAAISRKTLFDDEGNVQEEDSEDDDPFAKPDSDLDVSSDSAGGAEVSKSENEDDGSQKNDDLSLGLGVEDPENEDSEIDSNEAFGEGDEEIFKSKGFVFRGSNPQGAAAEDEAGSEQEGNSDEDGALVWDTEDEAEVDSDQDEEMEDVQSESEEDSNLSGDESDSDRSESSNQPTAKRNKPKTLLENEVHESEDPSASDSDISSNQSSDSRKNLSQRSKLKSLLSNETSHVAATLSASANADAAKGRAVQTQYQTFDRLLDARIKLQKGLAVANDLALPSNLSEDAEIQTAAQSAESAALRLFDTIEAIRQSISDASSSGENGRKRKRPENSSPTTAAALWDRLSSLEDQALPARRATLNRWAAKHRAEKVQSQSLNNTRPKLTGTTTTAVEESLTSRLDQQISSSSPTTDLPNTFYDDTSFYQSLLRDLISSRASLSQSQTTLPQLEEIPLPTTATPRPKKQHRANLDVKASKGRKVRYTVHEKLQNFTAEEVRETWSESARREFFASLFGGSVGRLLDEDEEEDVNMDEGNEEMNIREEGALRLFRS